MDMMFTPKAEVPATALIPLLLSRQTNFFNRKQDIALGARGTWFIKDWLHLLHEFDLT